MNPNFESDAAGSAHSCRNGYDLHEDEISDVENVEASKPTRKTLRQNIDYDKRYYSSAAVYASSAGAVLNNSTGKLSRCDAPEFDASDTAYGSLLHFVRVPRHISEHKGGFSQISVGSSRICALGTDQHLLCWGADKVQQMSLNCKAKLASQAVSSFLSPPNVATTPEWLASSASVSLFSAGGVRVAYRNESSVEEYTAAREMMSHVENWEHEQKSAIAKDVQCIPCSRMPARYRHMKEAPLGVALCPVATPSCTDPQTFPAHNEKCSFSSQVGSKSESKQSDGSGLPKSISDTFVASANGTTGRVSCESDFKISEAVCSSCVNTHPAGSPVSTTFAFPASSQGHWGKRQCHSSCKTCDTANSATSCTSCANANHFTILDAERRTGICHAQHCHLCKPRSCCGPDHKHLLVDATNMAGVCVRHTDSCSNHCLGGGGVKKKICSKGCNMFNLQPVKTTQVAVCQGEKVTVCPEASTMQPGVALFHNTDNSDTAVVLGSSRSTIDGMECQTQQKVECKASCSGLEMSEVSVVGAAGPTCLLSILQLSRCFDNGLIAQNVACGEVISACKKSKDLLGLAKIVLRNGACTKQGCGGEHCSNLAMSF